MLYFSSNLKKLFTANLLLAVFLLFGFNFHVQSQETLAVTPKFEYAIFYMETEGEFVVPVGADAPAIYSWSDPSGTIKGDIPEIWRHLNIAGEIEYSFTNIESVLLNHVANLGWVLLDLEITSVPIASSDLDFRTAYRYIFKRVKTESVTKQ